MFGNQDPGEGFPQIAFDAFSMCRHYRQTILRGDMMPCGGQTVKMRCQPLILLHATAIFIGKPEMKQCPFMPDIGGHGKPDISFGMIGCSILALIF